MRDELNNYKIKFQRASITKEEIRRQAYKETLKIIPLVVADTITFFPKKVVKFFGRKENIEEV